MTVLYVAVTVKDEEIDSLVEGLSAVAQQLRKSNLDSIKAYEDELQGDIDGGFYHLGVQESNSELDVHISDFM